MQAARRAGTVHPYILSADVSRWLWFAVVPLLIAAAYLTLLYLVQRSMLFPAPPAMPAGPGRRAEVVRVKTNGDDAYGLFLAGSVSGPAPLLIFTHGNGELADYWIDEFDEARRAGIGVLLAEYPGYGAAPGSPSEASIVRSAMALYDWAANDARVDPKRIVAHGRSLGGGAAARLAIERPVAALILESAFTSVADFAARFMAPPFLVRDPFDNRQALRAYRGPLLVIHGTHDTIVPIAHGRELAALVAGARFHEMNCGHNDCPRQWDVIRAFLIESGVLRP
jgi:fermentation-respiration switch protein FrsA (DUF1100 family)